MPNVVQKQRARSFKEVFVYLYHCSNYEGEVELNADKARSEIGVSRSQFYEAVKFLKRVRLLFTIEERTGRGNHSLCKLNWRKPAKKCPALSTKDIKSLSLRKDRLVQRHEISNSRWGKMLKAFRELLQKKTFLTTQEVQLCCGVLGRYLRGKPLGVCRSVYNGLAAQVTRWKLEPPNWVLEVRQLCAWFMSRIKLTLQSDAYCTKESIIVK